MKKKTQTINYDVIISGGGLAGLTLTALLAARGVRTLCVDRDPPVQQKKPGYDTRTTAISWGSRQVLEAAGLWAPLEKDACAIETIHILDGDSAVLLPFSSREAGGRTFGWIVDNTVLRHALLQKVKTLKNAEHRAPATVTDFAADETGIAVTLADGTVVRGKLAVGADGRNSFARESAGIYTRRWSYGQRAVVCAVAHENPHDNIAVEHFFPQGPFAILPMTDAPDGTHRSSVVWTEHGPEKKSARHFDEDSFNAALNARFPARYGAVKLLGARAAWPLGLVHAQDYVAPRMALVADAAHGIHPIAGQGLNLGFRDIAALADCVAGADDPGAPAILAAYQRQRRLDNMAMAGATDILNRLFSNDVGMVRAARRIGLRAVARLPAAKRFFMAQAMGAA